MTRKSKCSQRLSSRSHLPLTFGPFARSIALLKAAKRAKHRHRSISYEEKFCGSTSGNGAIKDDSLTNNAALTDSASDEFDGIVQADFVFSDPKPSDFHGVKLLLQTYLDAKEWDLSGFVDLILEQTTVGSVVKVEEDEDEGVYGFVTALSMGRYKDHKCFKELKEYMTKASQNDDTSSCLRSLLIEKATLGLLVSQRVVNFPPQLLPHLYDALFDEVSWATEDEPTEVLRKSFCFKCYLMLTKIYMHRNAPKGKAGGLDRNADGVIYMKPEDEIYQELSSWSFTFPLHNQQVTTNELKDYRLTGLVMAIDASKISTFRKKLHSLIDEP